MSAEALCPAHSYVFQWRPYSHNRALSLLLKSYKLLTLWHSCSTESKFFSSRYRSGSCSLRNRFKPSSPEMVPSPNILSCPWWFRGDSSSLNQWISHPGWLFRWREDSPAASVSAGPLEHVHLSLPFVTTKNKEINATAVLWPSQVGTLTYVWWFGNNTEVCIPDRLRSK